MRPPFVWHPEYSIPWPPHRFAMWKFADLYNEVGGPYVTPQEAKIEGHCPRYVAAIESNTWDLRRIGFSQRPDHAALVRRSKLEVGGTMLAAELAEKHGIACNLAGGTHHAHYDYGAGYTIFNDLALTAMKHPRTLVVDLDVHQGDGTAQMLAGKAFTFSVHCADNYPFGFSQDYLGNDQSDLDVALPAGSGDSEVMAVLRKHLPWILDCYKPELVLYDAGVDAHKDDALGKFQCVDLFSRDVYVIDECVRRQVPIATVIGGGYDKDRKKLAQRHATVLHAATHVWQTRKL